MNNDPDEYAGQVARLNCEVGAVGSGKIRYAAAMYFYAIGELPPQILEIYRRCCNDDREDPVDLARFEGIPVSGIIPLSGRRS